MTPMLEMSFFESWQESVLCNPYVGLLTRVTPNIWVHKSMEVSESLDKFSNDFLEQLPSHSEASLCQSLLVQVLQNIQ